MQITMQVRPHMQNPYVDPSADPSAAGRSGGRGGVMTRMNETYEADEADEATKKAISKAIEKWGREEAHIEHERAIQRSLQLERELLQLERKLDLEEEQRKAGIEVEVGIELNEVVMGDKPKLTFVNSSSTTLSIGPRDIFDLTASLGSSRESESSLERVLESAREPMWVSSDMPMEIVVRKVARPGLAPYDGPDGALTFLREVRDMALKLLDGPRSWVAGHLQMAISPSLDRAACEALRSLASPAVALGDPVAHDLAQIMSHRTMVGPSAQVAQQKSHESMHEPTTLMGWTMMGIPVLVSAHEGAGWGCSIWCPNDGRAATPRPFYGRGAGAIRNVYHHDGEFEASDMSVSVVFSPTRDENEGNNPDLVDMLNAAANAAANAAEVRTLRPEDLTSEVRENVRENKNRAGGTP